MKKLSKIFIVCLVLGQSLSVVAQQISPYYFGDSVTLLAEDCFVMAQYAKVEYVNDKNGVPSTLSALYRHNLINFRESDLEISDVNYVYFVGYKSSSASEGPLVQLVPKKHIPRSYRKEVRSLGDRVDRFWKVDNFRAIDLGYWRKTAYQYGVEGRKELKDSDSSIVFVIRDKTKVHTMRDFRVFIAKPMQQSLIVHHAMNPKDEYLFYYQFKKDLNADVNLPLDMRQLFKTDTFHYRHKTEYVRTEYDTIWENRLDTIFRERVFDPMNDSVQLPPDFVVTRFQTVQKKEVKEQRDTTVVVDCTFRYWELDTIKRYLDNRGANLIEYDSIKIRQIYPKENDNLGLKDKMGRDIRLAAKKDFLLEAYNGGNVEYGHIKDARYKVVPNSYPRYRIHMNVKRPEPYRGNPVYYEFLIPYDPRPFTAR